MTPPILGHRLPRRRLLLLAGSATAAALARFSVGHPARAQSADEGVVRQALANGLPVLIDQRNTAETLAVQLTARDGARNDPALPGISVITSRMIFQGTARRPSESELQRAVAAVGGTLSRGTGTELSTFTAVVPSRESDTAFDLLSDIALNALLAPDALARQQQIALQEIAQRRAQPSSYIDEIFQSNIFPGHPAGTPVLGTPDTISSITPDEVVDWRDGMWTGANLALTIVGRIRPEDALAQAEQYFGALAAGAPIPQDSSAPDVPDEPRLVTATAGQQQAVFRVGYLAPPLLDADRYPMSVLNAIMTGTSGRLYRSVRGERGLAYVAGSGYTPLSDTGSWFATAGVDPDNVDAALEIVREEISRIREKAPDADETLLHQNQIAGRQILADETNAARANRLASRELQGTEPTDEYVRRIREVTPDDVLRVAQAYFDPDQELVVIVGPDTSGEPAGHAPSSFAGEG